MKGHRRKSTWDHPRVCGEQIIKVTLDDSKEGSSPRVRGTEGMGVSKLDLKGIIPACAGNSKILDVIGL